MNTASANRRRIRLGQASATSGFRISERVDESGHLINTRVFGEDRYPTLWPCKKGHPIYRVGIAKDGRLYCNECELERRREHEH